MRAVDKIIAVAEQITRQAERSGPLGERRATRSLALSVGVVLLLFFTARVLLELNGLSTSGRVIIALMPLPAFVWFLLAFTRAIRDADELERTIQLEALAMAFPLTTLLLMTLGLLQIAIPLSADDWSYRHIFPLLYVFYLLGMVRARRRYA